MEVEEGLQRWIVDVSKWNPTAQDFSMAVALLPSHEHRGIDRFVKLEDRKRALVSRMLQYALVHRVLGLPVESIDIKRTPQGKPFLVCDGLKSRFPNFNFNVSHHGDYVAIASEPLCLVGLDIVSYSVPVNGTADEFLRKFSPYFTHLEWCGILSSGSDDNKLRAFYRYWSLKEAFVKAIGTGVGYEMDSIEFHHESWGNISVKVAGEVLSDWKFWLLELDKHHAMLIARGNPKLAANSDFLTRTEFDDMEYNAGFNLPNVGLRFLAVEELIELMPRPFQDDESN